MMTSTPAIIHVVDDNPSFLAAISRLLQAAGFEVLTFSSAAEFLQRPAPETPGCAVLDLCMPGPSGMELQAALAQAENPLPVIFLTGHGDIPTSVNAMRQGAVDFLTKPVQKEALFDAVERALARDAKEREHRSRRRELRLRYARLTPREREVAGHVVAGWPNKQIAAKLGTCERTIKAHRAAIMEKLQVHCVADLVRLAQALEEQPVANGR